MRFPVSGVETPIWLPPLVAFAISFFTSMGGVSGAFLLLPFQVSILGFTSPAVSPTNLVFNIVAIPSGIYRYLREGRMIWPLAWAVIIGTLPGVIAGGFIRIIYLPDPRSFKIFVACVLLYIGGRLLIDFRPRPSHQGPVAREFKAGNSGPNPGDTDWKVQVLPFDWKSLGFSFQGRTYRPSFWGIFILSLAVGIVGGVYGIGGGAIMAPFFVAVFGLPVHAVAGATLAGTFLTSVVGVSFYQAIAPFYGRPNLAVAPDWLLGALFGIGGLAGMYVGARTQRYIPARRLKLMLALLILFVAVRYLI